MKKGLRKGVVLRERIDYFYEGTQKRSLLHKVWEGGLEEFYELRVEDPLNGGVVRVEVSADIWKKMAAQERMEGRSVRDVDDQSEWGGQPG